ncbi:tripartite tricarboxylate transporter substrate binding protein [Leptospira sp. severe_002]|uniref:tripartite tricarboxylate transporter substrate binding protein n=1 Tax=Leptospira sp. severe_002 TaxID=2838237 RepID=UPI001E5F596E|nr:tripartite tricarboxylate transporter substrate binding protein [Leptospira sp. severe_002]
MGRSRVWTVLHLFLAVAAFAFATTDIARSESYPTRPVRVVVPFQPGGVVDIMARLVSQKLSESLGQNFYVENRGGGGGNTGAAIAQAAAPDGYTILFTSSSFLVNPGVQKVPYEPVKGFSPITITSASPSILAINPAVPAKTVSELVAAIRQAPEKYSFSSTGFGSTPHLQGEMFKLAYKLELVHVPFGGGGPALQSTMSGHTPLTFAALPPAIPLVKEGKLRALAVVGPDRVDALPDVPTMAEAGTPGFDAQTILLVLAPAGTPKPIVELLHKEIVKVLREPEILQKFSVQGFTPVGSTPEQTAKRIETELAMWARIAREANLQQQQ